MPVLLEAIEFITQTADETIALGRELAATMVLSMPIQDWSMKISGSWPTDPADDVAGGAWAGLVPFQAQVGDPQPAPDLRAGIPVPASVRAMTLRCPQRRGSVGHDRVNASATRE